MSRPPIGLTNVNGSLNMPLPPEPVALNFDVFEAGEQ